MRQYADLDKYDRHFKIPEPQMPRIEESAVSTLILTDGPVPGMIVRPETGGKISPALVWNKALQNRFYKRKQTMLSLLTGLEMRVIYKV